MRESTTVRISEHFQMKPVRRRQHFLFNLLCFLYFRSHDYEGGFSIESRSLGLVVIIPYIVFAEIYFFRKERHFIMLRSQMAGILAIHEKTDALYISVLAVSPHRRKMGVATHVLSYVTALARQLHKSAIELSVLRANTPALKLYLKYGFTKKEERKRSFILRKGI